MATQSSFITKVITTGSFIVAAALIAPASMNFNVTTKAFAEESHEGSTGHKGTKGGSEKGHKGKGAEDSHGSKKDLVSKGQGGPDETSDGKGPKRGQPTSQGGKKVWASEGIDTTVEYGRLNIMRAPQHVRDQALLEALKNSDWSLYNKSLTDAINSILVYRTDPSVIRIDSPSEAIALYQALLRDGKINLVQTQVNADGSVSIVKDANGNPVYTGTSMAGDSFVQAAIFLASASDKTKPIYTTTVQSVNIVLGGTSGPLLNPIKIPDDPATTTINEEVRYTDLEMAKAAEYVRRAIEAGHDAVTATTPATITEPTDGDVTPPPAPTE